MSEELKPCPFCGDKAVQKDMDTPFKNGWIGCPKCHCFIDWIKNGKPQAITAWNTRADGWISVDERGMLKANEPAPSANGTSSEE